MIEPAIIDAIQASHPSITRENFNGKPTLVVEASDMPEVFRRCFPDTINVGRVLYRIKTDRDREGDIEEVHYGRDGEIILTVFND